MDNQEIALLALQLSVDAFDAAQEALSLINEEYSDRLLYGGSEALKRYQRALDILDQVHSEGLIENL